MYETPLNKILFKAISLDTFYNYMKMYQFPFKVKESNIMCFFLLPILVDDYKLVLDFPHADEVVNKMHTFLKEQGCESPIFDYYRNINPNYETFKLFIECYNAIRITPYNCYVPLSIDPNHKSMAVKLVSYGYANEKAIKNPELCSECMTYLKSKRIAYFNPTTRLFYFEYKLLPKNIQFLISQKNIDEKKYLFSREIFQDTMLPDMVEKR